MLVVNAKFIYDNGNHQRPGMFKSISQCAIRCGYVTVREIPQRGMPQFSTLKTKSSQLWITLSAVATIFFNLI